MTSIYIRCGVHSDFMLSNNNNSNSSATKRCGKTAKSSLSAGFEPAREDPNGFLVHRLNHSATTTDGEHISGLKNITLMFFSSSSSIQFYGATVPASPVQSGYVRHVRTGQGWTRNRCVTHPPMTYMSSRSVVRQNATSVVKNHRFFVVFCPPKRFFFFLFFFFFFSCSRIVLYRR